MEAAKMKRAASFLPRDHDDHHHFGGGGDGDRHHGGDGHHDGGHHNHKDNSDDGEDSGDDDGDDDSGSDGSDDEDSDGSDDENSDEDSGSDDDDDDGDDDDNDDGDGGSDDNVGGDADGGGQVGNNISGVAPGNPAATTTPSQLPTFTSSVSAGPTTLASTSAKQPSANIGAIVGSVLGILVLLVVVVLLLIRPSSPQKTMATLCKRQQNPLKPTGSGTWLISRQHLGTASHLTLPEPVSPHRSWFSSLARLPQPPEQSRFSDPTETDVESTRSTTLSFLRPTDVDRDSNPSVPPYPSSSSPTRLSAGSTIASSASRWSFVDPFRDPPKKGSLGGQFHRTRRRRYICRGQMIIDTHICVRLILLPEQFVLRSVEDQLA
ncbi:hypothetical protein CPB85DRAFT_1437389 [Mucidula mucida]|nr:hypothetical protein CPB85DRAFT_1437389 [Mucidula mucida]